MQKCSLAFIDLYGASIFLRANAAPCTERQLRPSLGHLLKSLPNLELLALLRPTAALQGVKCIVVRLRHDQSQRGNSRPAAQ